MVVFPISISAVDRSNHHLLNLRNREREKERERTKKAVIAALKWMSRLEKKRERKNKMEISLWT